MRKFWRSSAAIAMSVMMAAALTACGGSTGSTGASTGSSESTEQAAESTEAAPAGAIVIGGSGPLTGGAAMYGNAVKNGAEIAVEEINAKGGIQFQLEFEDDQHKQEEAVTAFGKLMDNGMQISLLTVTSDPGAAVAPMYKDENIFAITPSGSSFSVIYADADNLKDPFGNVFQMCFTDPAQGTSSAIYISEHPELGDKIGIIYKNDDNYSKGIYDTFKSKAAELGLQIVYEGTFKGEEADFSVQVSDAMAAGVNLMYLPIYYTPASQILTEANKQGFTSNFFGVDGMDGILGVENFDVSLAEGLYLMTPFNAAGDDERTKSFVEAYKAKTGEIPNQFAADAYDCVYAMLQACETAGITADMSNEDICKAMVEQFTTMSFTGLTGSNMSWSTNGDVTKDPLVVVIQNGAYVNVD